MKILGKGRRETGADKEHRICQKKEQPLRTGNIAYTRDSLSSNIIIKEDITDVGSRAHSQPRKERNRPHPVILVAVPSSIPIMASRSTRPEDVHARLRRQLQIRLNLILSFQPRSKCTTTTSEEVRSWQRALDAHCHDACWHRPPKLTTIVEV